MSLKRLRRTTRPRPLLLLIDVSGSMKERTDAHLALAYTVVHAARNVEVFTLGTRFTRVTRALRRRNSQQASPRLPAWFPTGTGERGSAMRWRVPLACRVTGASLGATVVILSDGLERGDPSALIAAVQRLAARAYRIDWLAPRRRSGIPAGDAGAARSPPVHRRACGRQQHAEGMPPHPLHRRGARGMTTGIVDAHFHIWSWTGSSGRCSRAYLWPLRADPRLPDRGVSLGLPARGRDGGRLRPSELEPRAVHR